MKKLFLIIVVNLVGLSMYAQQDSQFTQYMYNTVNFNPAYAGSRDVLSVFVLHRTQWVGLDGAPQTNAFSMNTPLKNTNLGLGISFINDRIGPSDENSISADLSYSIPTSETYKLAFGVKATANLLNVDYGKLNIYNPGDVLGQGNLENKFTPNIGAGAFFYSSKTYLGLSIPNFLETKHFDKAVSSYASEKMHVFFTAGHVFDLSQEVKFKPALLTKIVKGAPLQVDLSANFLFNNKFTLGAAYRWDAAFSALAGFQVSDSWFIGYAYDREITNLANFNSGSHEIFLRYELFKNLGKVVSPRFF